ncbi:MAG: hypothetical protein AB1633_00770 [Elusimicrobiota bacterium]
MVIPKLSPAVVIKNGKKEGVILSVKEYEAVKNLLEDLEDHLDFEARQNEPVEDFHEFLGKLKIVKRAI